MTRRVFNLLAVLFLAAAAGIAALWARSYFVQDGLQVTFRADMVSAYSSAGTIAGVWDTGLPPMPNSVHRVTDEKPAPVGGSYWRALVTFHVGSLTWGGSNFVQFPHWVAVALLAPWPIARFVRARRRHSVDAGGFPVATP